MSRKTCEFSDKSVSPICHQSQPIRLKVEQLDPRNSMKNTFSQKIFRNNRIEHTFTAMSASGLYIQRFLHAHARGAGGYLNLCNLPNQDRTSSSAFFFTGFWYPPMFQRRGGTLRRNHRIVPTKFADFGGYVGRPAPRCPSCCPCLAIVSGETVFASISRANRTGSN